jgi:AraC-like DNA-binding protein
MKPLVEKLPLAEDASFVARTHRTPNFEVPWHQHAEHELILFTEGAGLSFIGNYVGDFQKGDIFFLGSNLPHTFQRSPEVEVTSAVVIHFKADFWGRDFLQIPESKRIKNLLDIAAQGIKVCGKTKKLLNTIIQSIEKDKGFRRVLHLCECLCLLSDKEEYTTLSTQEVKVLNTRDQERIDRVFQYTMDNFKEPIELAVIADIAGMSIPAFCNYFKKRTKKTYVNFVNEVRIGNACKLLEAANKTIIDVCYESGFNSVANFNRQFLRIKGITPSAYKKASSINNQRFEIPDKINVDHSFRDLF